MIRSVDYYFIGKGKGPDMFLTDANKWTKDLRKAIIFDNLRMAQDYLQSSKLRAGRVVFHETVGTITDNRYETESFFRELPENVRT